jgi:hypothetical protein
MNATNSRMSVKWIGAGMVGALAMGVLWLGVGAGYSPPGEENTPGPLHNKLCPDDLLAIELPDGTTVTDIPLASSIDELHEFHDCQRLITVPDLNKFGQRVVIFASEQLASLELSDNPQPFAVIYNFGETPYDPLFIDPGFSCLFLWKEGTVPKAKMSHNGYDENACSDVFEDPTAIPGQLLEARYAVQPGPPRVVPPVARWDWDGTYQFIGIKCGTEWCEIWSPKGTGKSPPREWNHFANLPGNARLPHQPPPGRVRKGWYDEQRLAVVDAVTNELKPADSSATALPHPRLTTRTTSWYHDKWRPAAFVVLREDLQEYEDEKNWKRGVNQVSLCWNSGTTCGNKDGLPACTPEESNDTRTWWSRTKSPGNDVTYNCVKRCDRDTPIPGTVRFRWLEQDEKLWIRCGTGCCTDG